MEKFIKKYKELGCETKLIFSYNGVTGNKFIGINPFENIFDSNFRFSLNIYFNKN